MRLLLALLALFSLAAAAPQRAASRDWSTVAAKLPDGTYLIGNPAARVKLVEYASLTCSHCADFATQSEPVLRERMIRSGQVSVEYRHFLFNMLDLGAVVLARCTGPARFADTVAFVYRTQPDWLTRGANFQRSNGARIAMYPPLAQMRAFVDGSGLTAAIVARGLSPAAVDACFADTAEINRITDAAGRLPPGVTSTPTFFLQGRMLGPTDWARLEPQLRAAGVR